MKKKKLISMLLISSIIASMGLVGCGNNENTDKVTNDTEVNITEDKKNNKNTENLFGSDADVTEIPFCDVEDDKIVDVCKIKIPNDIWIGGTNYYDEDGKIESKHNDYYMDKYATTPYYQEGKFGGALIGHFPNDPSYCLQSLWVRTEKSELLYKTYEENEEHYRDAMKNYKESNWVDYELDGARAFACKFVNEDRKPNEEITVFNIDTVILMIELDDGKLIEFTYQGMPNYELSTKEIGDMLLKLIVL